MQVDEVLRGPTGRAGSGSPGGRVVRTRTRRLRAGPRCSLPIPRAPAGAAGRRRTPGWAGDAARAARPPRPRPHGARVSRRSAPCPPRAAAGGRPAPPRARARGPAPSRRAGAAGCSRRGGGAVTSALRSAAPPPRAPAP